MIKSLLLFAAGLSAYGQSTQAGPTDELFRTIAALDTALFEAYNTCDLAKFSGFFTDDVEFYHDQGGLTVGVKTITEQVKNNICGKVRRELVAGSLQIYPMKGYGAVEIGSHRFYLTAKPDEPSGVAKFIHLWQKQGDVWRIARVISYDHVALSK